MMFRVLLTALLFANIQWSVAQEDEIIESTAGPEIMSTEDDMSSTELESTEDEMSSTEYGSDSGSDSDDDDEEESDEDDDDSSDLSTTDDSDSDSDSSDSSATESSEDDDSDSSATESSDDDDDEEESQDDVASDDDEMGSQDSDGTVLESEEDDQDTDDESTEGPEDIEEDEVDVAGEDEDSCVGLDADECGSTFGDDGAQLCGYNTMTDDCYEVVMTAGTRGKGNFDDGYTAAQAQADEQAAQLYTAIGILGGIMGILILTVLGGGYYIYSSKKDSEYKHTPVAMEVIDVDGGSTRTRGNHNRIQSHSHHYTSDSMPMLDTM